MTTLAGSGFALTSPLAAAGAAANGTVLTLSELGDVTTIQTDGSLAGSTAIMHADDALTVDTDNDGDFSDEIAATQTDNDRYVNSEVQMSDGDIVSVTLEVISLSDGSQVILIQDASVHAINANGSDIVSITLGTFNTRFDDRYHQGNFTNTINANVVCFLRGTLIDTSKGQRAIDSLLPGDEIKTFDNGMQTLKWIGSQRVAKDVLEANANLLPITIEPNALGDGFPKTRLTVSPQHRIFIRSKIAKSIFGMAEILVPAKKMLGIEGINQSKLDGDVEYFHMLFSRHEVVSANKALCESLFPGKEALKTLSHKSLSEISLICPDFYAGSASWMPARPILQARKEINRLIDQHNSHRSALYDPYFALQDVT